MLFLFSEFIYYHLQNIQSSFFHIAKYFSIQIHVKKLPLFSLIRKSDHLCPDAFPTQIALIFYLIYIPINKKGL